MRQRKGTSKMRIVFMGTPDFSVPALTALVEAGHDVIAVVTQPDKPKGRGKLVQMTPVKEKALEYGIPVYQPVKARDPEFVSLLKEMKPDAMVVAAFGQLLPKTILDIPKYGCVNIHASQVPRRSSDSVRGDQRGIRQRNHHHDDGADTGYGRYPGSGVRCSR